jgi:hypothetical protein
MPKKAGVNDGKARINDVQGGEGKIIRKIKPLNQRRRE